MVAVLWDSISTSFLCWVFFFFFSPLAFLSSLTQFSVITISHFARLLLLPARFAYTQSSTSLTISIHGKAFWCLCCPIHSGTECHTSAVCFLLCHPLPVQHVAFLTSSSLLVLDCDYTEELLAPRLLCIYLFLC